MRARLRRRSRTRRRLDATAPEAAPPVPRVGLLHRATGVQARPRTGHAGDAHEQEADRVADAVVRASVPEAGTQAPAPRPAGPLSDALGAGRPLADRDRADTEAHLGHDLGAVRIHDDARAAEVAGHFGARAVTAGADVAFGRGEYAPGTDRGRHLLAHELTHVAQQSRGTAPAVQRQDATPTTARTRVELACPGTPQNAVTLVSTPWQARFGIGHPANVGDNDLFIAGLDANGKHISGQGSYRLAPGESGTWYYPPKGAAQIAAACSKHGAGSAVLEYDAPIS